MLSKDAKHTQFIELLLLLLSIHKDANHNKIMLTRIGYKTKKRKKKKRSNTQLAKLFNSITDYIHSKVKVVSARKSHRKLQMLNTFDLNNLAH